MRFFVGLHHPYEAYRFPAAFISVNALGTRKRPFEANDWILDSGAFSTIFRHGRYLEPVQEYASKIRRWSRNGQLLAAVSQDYMCEASVLERTGLSVAEHQHLTIERYDRLLACDLAGVYLMPVLQGFAPSEYVDHLEQYGDRLARGAWVGVGSVCKRNATPVEVENVLRIIRSSRNDLRLHGFGLKITSLASELIRDALYSADSMAWSYAARKQGRDANSWLEAKLFVKEIETMPIQRVLIA